MQPMVTRQNMHAPENGLTDPEKSPDDDEMNGAKLLLASLGNPSALLLVH